MDGNENISASEGSIAIHSVRRAKGIRLMLVCILGLAGIRVFLYCGSFPPCNSVDEAAHYDLVVKYSKGDIPQKPIEMFSPEVAQLLALYASPEYFFRAEQAQGGKFFGPLAKIPNIKQTAGYARLYETVLRKRNYESFSLPTYYAGAGLWCALGRGMGLEGVSLFYWVRFLNVPTMMLLVWICYRLAREVFPESLYFQIGLPLLAGCMPNNILYAVNSDVFSAMFYGASAYMLVRIGKEDWTWYYYAATGLMIAATFLIKFTNITVFILLAVMAGWKAYCLHREKRLGGKGVLLGVLLTCALVPAGSWLIRNQILLGDWTGTASKIRHLGWSEKPLDQWGDHPIFTGKGIALFFSELTTTFWRGEVLWHGEAHCNARMDRFYVISTAILLAAGAGGGWLLKRKYPEFWKLYPVYAAVLAISIGMLGILSIRYDFGGCINPSRAHPFFSAGRLILGMTVPFLMLYLYGLRVLCYRWKETWIPIVLVIMLAMFLVGGELYLNWEVLGSAYNVFHAPLSFEEGDGLSMSTSCDFSISCHIPPALSPLPCGSLS